MVHMQRIQINTFKGDAVVKEANPAEKTPAIVETENDMVEVTKKKETQEFGLSSELDKKITVAKAKKLASSWAIGGGVLVTGYYWLRPDKSIAKNYNLEEQKDSNLINEIRSEQIKATVPATIASGLGLFNSTLGLIAGVAVGVGCWLHYKNKEKELRQSKP